MHSEKDSSAQSTEAKRYLKSAYANADNGDLENALRECAMSIQLDPNYAEAYNLRGVILDEMGRTEEALAAYREAIRLDPTFIEAQENLLELDTELSKDKSKEATSTTVEGKKFGVRAGAYIIDVVALYVSNLATGLVVGTILGIVLVLTGRRFYLDNQVLQGWNLLRGLVLSTLYFVVFEWLYGATLGKLILGMRVVRPNGEPCGLGAAIIRALLRYVDGLFFALLAYASMKHPLYQRIGDKAAKTIVIGSKDPAVRKPRAWWWFLIATGLYLTLTATIVILALIAALR